MVPCGRRRPDCAWLTLPVQAALAAGAALLGEPAAAGERVQARRLLLAGCAPTWARLESLARRGPVPLFQHTLGCLNRQPDTPSAA